jgi:hypothetical protein
VFPRPATEIETKRERDAWNLDEFYDGVALPAGP